MTEYRMTQIYQLIAKSARDEPDNEIFAIQIVSYILAVFYFYE